MTGAFGKGSLCPDPRAKPEEARRRANRLAECVEYVRWHALRHAPGRTLVITYLDIEEVFADIPTSRSRTSTRSPVSMPGATWRR